MLIKTGKAGVNMKLNALILYLLCFICEVISFDKRPIAPPHSAPAASLISKDFCE